MDKQTINRLLETAKSGTTWGLGPYTATLHLKGNGNAIQICMSNKALAPVLRDELLRRIRECPQQDWRETVSPENPVWCWVSNENEVPSILNLAVAIRYYDEDYTYKYTGPVRDGWKYATPCTEEECALLAKAREKVG